MVGTLSQSDYTGLCTQGLRTQGLHAQGWWGHLANQITQGLCARMRVQGVHAGVVGTLSQSDYIGLRVQGLCAGVVHCDWLLSLANQIFQI